MKPIMEEDIARVNKRLQKVIKEKPLQKDRDGGESLIPVRCFGCFDVRDRHQQLVKWPTRKAEELFAYFLIRQGQYISKWELLELFWADVAEERGLQNLYNTIYRIKQVLKEISPAPGIKKVNDGYVLEAEEAVSDLRLLLSVENKSSVSTSEAKEIAALFFLYKTPLFGNRDYFWSFSVQEYVAGLYRKLCSRLLGHYREQNQFQLAEEVICHYILQHVEDEGMMEEWLKLLGSWRGCEGKAVEYRAWFNEKLREAELPTLKDGMDFS